jgi:hypothetical protein
MARAGGGALVDIPMVVATNSTGPGVPLALYPPGADLSGFDIVDSITGESVSGAVYVVSASSPLRASPMGGGGGATPDDLTNDVVSPETGFFRVFHIPDWLVTFAGYQFDGPTFIPVDFSEPDAPTNCVENLIVLINGQPTDDALFTTDVIDGTTYSGMGIYFDRFPNGTNTIQLLTTVRQSDSLEGATPNMTFSNAVQSIVINNFAIYTNWNDTIYTNPFTIQARAATTNINWEIDIYDVNGDLKLPDWAQRKRRNFMELGPNGLRWKRPERRRQRPVFLPLSQLHTGWRWRPGWSHAAHRSTIPLQRFMAFCVFGQ